MQNLLNTFSPKTMLFRFLQRNTCLFAHFSFPFFKVMHYFTSLVPVESKLLHYFTLDLGDFAAFSGRIVTQLNYNITA